MDDSPDVLTFSFRENDSLISQFSGQDGRVQRETRIKYKPQRARLWHDKLSSSKGRRMRNHRFEVSGGLCKPSLLSSADLRATGDGSRQLIESGAWWVMPLSKCYFKSMCRLIQPALMVIRGNPNISVTEVLINHSFLATCLLENYSVRWVYVTLWTGSKLCYSLRSCCRFLIELWTPVQACRTKP